MSEILVLPNGPYAVDAEGLKLLSLGGDELKIPDGGKVFLCRCGRSANKPFCDSTHRKVGFEHDPDAQGISE